MLELIHSNSSRVQFEASRHVLALAGLKPASDASVSVSIGVEVKAGYVIDLSEPGQPAAKIVDCQVLDAKPVD